MFKFPKDYSRVRYEMQLVKAKHLEAFNLFKVINLANDSQIVIKHSLCDKLCDGKLYEIYYIIIYISLPLISKLYVRIKKK